MGKRLHGAEIISFSSEEARQALDWLCAGGKRLEATSQDFRWAVIQATDSLVWGVSRNGTWRWASGRADTEAPHPAPDTLLEARAFGPSAELLIWRRGTEFGARLLRDEGEVVTGPLAPLDRRSLFLPVPDEAGRLAGRIRPTPDPDFVRRQGGDGRTLVTPRGAGVLLRNYVESEAETGLLRVAATRFVQLIDA